MRWFTLGENTEVSAVEANAAFKLCRTLDQGNADIVTQSTLSINGDTDTTLLVMERPGERLLFIKRLDGSLVVATDRFDYSDNVEWR